MAERNCYVNDITKKFVVLKVYLRFVICTYIRKCNLSIYYLGGYILRLSIVNFSDVHFKSENNSILEKKKQLMRAITSRVSNSEKKLFIMNGDSAFSGKKEEYEVAFDFFSDIISNFEGSDFLCIPGNHDCDFNEMDSVIRETLLETIKEDEDKRNDLIGKVILQNKYEEYFSTFMEFWESSELVDEGAICKVINFSINEELRIRINLINTAWDSTLHEKAGTMYMPKSELELLKYDNEALFNFSIIHHPTHWLEPNNKREFDRLLEDISDFIFTGHEHQDSQSSKISQLGETIILEGNVLQENYDPKISGFNILTIEIEDSIVISVTLVIFTWDSNKNMYDAKESDEISIDTMRRRIQHASSGDNERFFIKDSMYKWVNDLGAYVVHPRHGNLDLNNIFVYPDFKNSLEEKKNKEDIDAENLLTEIMDNEGVWFIEGDKEAGKTTLLKKLYLDFFDKGYVPIVIDGELIKDKEAPVLKKIEKLVKKEFDKQYEGNMHEHFLQLDISKKVLLLDNWDRVDLNKIGKKELIKNFTRIFSTIIIVSESLPNNTSDVLGLNDELKNNIKFIGIKKFGFKKREELVDKWIRLGNEYIKEEKEIIFDVDKYTKQIDEVIGKSYVPQVPLYILIILQSIDSGRELSDFKSQSNGYYYELLIKQLINDVGIDNNEMSLLHNYLSYFGYKVFSSKEKALSYSAWYEFHDNYLEQYELDPKTMSFETYKKRLISSKIIKEFTGDRYTFTYNYALYFFVAQYLSNNISEDLIKNIIVDLIENINVEINANVLIFLTHLSKDDFIHKTVISVSNSLLSGRSELRMEDDIIELNQLMTELPTLIFKNTNVPVNREKYNKARDSNNKEEPHFIEANEKSDSDTVAESEQDKSLIGKNDILIEMDKAQKISEVIGQILKNYSGSIMKDTKRELLESAYSVALRAGNNLIDIIKSEKDELVYFISEKIVEDGVVEPSNQKEVEDASKRILFKFVEMICFSIIQKTVKDTGSNSLRITYSNLVKNDLSMIKKLIISGSYLETMYVDPSESYIHEVFQETEKNLMARSILQQMAAKYMYLFELSPQERQKIASQFGIRYDSVVRARLEHNK